MKKSDYAIDLLLKGLFHFNPKAATGGDVLQIFLNSHRINKITTYKGLWKAYSRTITSKKKAREFYKKHNFLPPRVLIVNPTTECQLACEDCATKLEREGNKNVTLPYEFLDSLITQFEELGGWGTVYMGGEPLAHSSKENILRAKVNNPGHPFMTFTNAIGLDDKFYEASMKNNNVYWQLSIDGLKDNSEARRGKGSFKFVEKAMKALSDHKIPYGISTTVMQNNYLELSSKEFMEFASDNNAISIIFFPYGPMDGNYDQMASIDERTEFDNRIENIRSETSISLLNYTKALNLISGCRAGGLHYYVTAEGEVTPCFTIGHSLGNAHDTPLENILTSPFSYEFKDLIAQHPKKCIMSTAPDEIIHLANKHNLKEITKITTNASRLLKDGNFTQNYLAQ